MITLPEQYVATKYPGYFWNMETQKLYSLKMSGVLTPLKLVRPSHWNSWGNFEAGRSGGYRISHNGIRKNLYLLNLKKLTLKDSVIPEEK